MHKLTIASESITGQCVARVTAACEGAVSVGADLSASSIVGQALIHITYSKGKEYLLFK